MSSSRPSFLEELRDPVTGRIIPLKPNVPSPSGGGGGAVVVSTSEVEGPTVSAILEHVEWSPERPGGPQFSPPGSPEEKTPAERIRPKESPSLQRQPCIGRKEFLEIIGCPPDAESLVPPPRIQRRLNLKGLQPFPPPPEEEEEDEEINPSAPKRYRVSVPTD